MIIYTVDDEPVLLKKLNKAVTDAVKNAEVYGFSRASALLEAIGKQAPMPDVAFIDIEMPGMGGIELAKQIKCLCPHTWIIFVTGFSQYAVEAYEIHARGYIMKPVTPERIREELEATYNIPLVKAENALIRVKCFGSFEVFADNEPVKFERSKTKELFAYLIDRNGAAVNTAMLCAVLWEDRADGETQRNYFRKLIADLSKTLSSIGAGDAFMKSRNSFAVDTSRIDCDYYRFLKRDPGAINAYTGEYMSQYSWAELTLGSLSDNNL